MASKTHQPSNAETHPAHAETHAHADKPATKETHANADEQASAANGKTAAAVAELPTQQAGPLVPPIAPPTGAKIPTHFARPLVSGGKEYVQGQVPLYWRADIDNKNGNFGGTAPGVPLVFPTGSIILRIITNVTVAFDGATPKINFGTTVGGTDIASLALGTLGKTESPTAPALLPALPTNNTIYVSVTGGPFTVGHASVALQYLGAPAAPWS